MFKIEAKSYLKVGINPVPFAEGGKIPVRKKWGTPINKDIDNYDFDEIGVCTGAVSGGLEGIDMDLYNSENPKELWQSWKSKIPENIYDKLVIAQTGSKGLHLLYRTNIITGNQELASNGESPPKVLIETRGEGGCLKCYPSKGYKFIQGDLSKVKKLEDYERDILFSASILFDKKLLKKKRYYSDKDFVDPFPKYNKDATIGLKLLEDNGWTQVRSSDEWVEFTRPGKSRGVSAGYNLEGCFFYCFSTSTEFENDKPYSNSSLFCILECESNFKVGYAKLGKLGYGNKGKSESEEDLTDLSFLSKEGEDEEKLAQVIEGTLPIGISYGWEALDKHLVWKDNTLNFTLAFESVGKTFVTIHKLVALAVLYGKKFGLSCGENEVYTVKKYLIEALSGKDISYFKKRYVELKTYKDFINAHFFVFKNEKHYAIEDILRRGKILYDEYGIDGLFIDPFSYYKKSLTNQYAYIDDLLSKMNIFSKTVCSIIMSLHPNTDATRAPKDKEGYLKSPNRYDATHGNMWANRGDSFIVYHRILNHRISQMRNIMEIRVEKIKDISTGGLVTASDESITLTLKNFNGFTGFFDKYNNNPIYSVWHHPNKNLNDARSLDARDQFVKDKTQ